jgi:hypothetical protein
VIELGSLMAGQTAFLNTPLSASQRGQGTVERFGTILDRLSQTVYKTLA